MGKTRRIPVVKNRVVLKKKRKKHPVWRLVGALVLIFALMLIFVWLKIQTNLKIAEIRNLKLALKSNLDENKKLEIEKIRLSTRSRIQNIAVEELGLEVIPDEKIIEISQN